MQIKIQEPRKKLNKLWDLIRYIYIYDDDENPKKLDLVIISLDNEFRGR